MNQCDETKPWCTRCTERHLFCDYPSPDAAPEAPADSAITPPRCSAVMSSMASSVAESQIVEVLGSGDNHMSHPRKGATSGTSGILEALSHFEHAAFSTMGTPHIQNTMRKNGLMLAQEAPFLFHAILAYTSHHLQYLQPTQQRFKQSATYYRQRGLELYRKELNGSITLHNMDAVFGACMIFAVLAYAADDIGPEKSFVFSEEPGAINWLSVQAGFLTLKTMRDIQPYLSSSIWGPLFRESDEQGLFYDTRTGAEGLPETFVELCGIDESSTDDNNPYHAALRLCMSIMHIKVNMQMFTKFISFPGRMRLEFFNIVRERDPVALLIVSYWLSRMCGIDQWWCIPRVKNECLAICAYLDGWPDARIQDLLEVPIRACGYVSYRYHK